MYNLGANVIIPEIEKIFFTARNETKICGLKVFSILRSLV